MSRFWLLWNFLPFYLFRIPFSVFVFKLFKISKVPACEYPVPDLQLIGPSAQLCPIFRALWHSRHNFLLFHPSCGLKWVHRTGRGVKDKSLRSKAGKEMQWSMGPGPRPNVKKIRKTFIVKKRNGTFEKIVGSRTFQNSMFKTLDLWKIRPHPQNNDKRS